MEVLQLPQRWSFPCFQDGREAADYKSLRETRGILKMLHDARTLDAYGEVRGQVDLTIWSSKF